MSETDLAFGTPMRAPGPAQKHRRTKLIIVLLMLLALAVFVAGIVLAYELRVAHRRFYIPSPSMEPSLQLKDTVSTDRVSSSTAINRGDIVVFDRPDGEPDKSIQFILKRVVGMPGETIEARDGVVYINGQKLNETYINTPTTDLAQTVIPANDYFVMGDNRPNSFDSRRFGVIEHRHIKYKATAVVKPKSHKKHL